MRRMIAAATVVFGMCACVGGCQVTWEPEPWPTDEPPVVRAPDDEPDAPNDGEVVVRSPEGGDEAPVGSPGGETGGTKGEERVGVREPPIRVYAMSPGPHADEADAVWKTPDLARYYAGRAYQVGEKYAGLGGRKPMSALPLDQVLAQLAKTRNRWAPKDATGAILSWDYEPDTTGGEPMHWTQFLTGNVDPAFVEYQARPVQELRRLAPAARYVGAYKYPTWRRPRISVERYRAVNDELMPLFVAAANSGGAIMPGMYDPGDSSDDDPNAAALVDDYTRWDEQLKEAKRLADEAERRTGRRVAIVPVISAMRMGNTVSQSDKEMRALLRALRDHGITEVIYWRNANKKDQIPAENQVLRTSFLDALRWVESQD